LQKGKLKVKQISKKAPQFYRDFVRKNSPTEWSDVSLSIGYELRMLMLMEEQNYQCAYTEIRVEPEDSHIDHFRKQSLFQNLIFDWNNLLVQEGESFRTTQKSKKSDFFKKSDFSVVWIFPPSCTSFL